MSVRRFRSIAWIVAPSVVLSAAAACSSKSDGGGAAPCTAAGGSGNHGGSGGSSAAGRAGESPMSAAGSHEMSAAGEGGEAGSGGSGGEAGEGEGAGTSSVAGGGSSGNAGSSQAGNGGTSDSGGASSNGGTSNAGGAAGNGGTSSSAGSGGTGGTSGFGGTTGSGGSGGAASASCIKKVNDWYVVRNDGKVLVEQRDTTKEALIMDADAHALSGASDVAVGTYHGCALLSNGTVWCWRENTTRGNWAGQLGNGVVDQDATSKLQRASQVLVDVGTPLTGVASLTRGGPNLQSTCAITTDQKLYCWGDVAWLINNGTALSSPYAQAITTNGIEPLTGVQQASTAQGMACAVVKRTATNELLCWGRNDYHNLGNGDAQSRQYPTKVASLTAPSMVSVVDYSYALSWGGTACAVDGGKLLCWGANGSGQTGTGVSGGDVTTPTAVLIQDGTTALPAPVDLTGITGNFCALAANKTVWCWGSYFNAAAGNYGATNVASLGGPVSGATNLYWLMYATNDGQFHWGKEWARSPNCGSL